MTDNNALIYHVNTYELQQQINIEKKISDWETYKKYFYEYCSKKNNKVQNDLLRYMKEKFTLVKDFENCELSNLVYIYTFKNKIVYIGKSFDRYKERLARNYHKQLFGQFAEKCNISTKNKDWKFYVYQSDKYDMSDVESYLINWFAKNGQPNLNVKCEDVKGLLGKNKLLKLK